MQTNQSVIWTVFSNEPFLALASNFSLNVMRNKIAVIIPFFLER